MIDPKRILFVAWQSRRTRSIHPVARLVQAEESPYFELAYIGGIDKAQEEGFVPFAGLENLHRVYHSEALFPFLANRLMSEKRPDYESYLSWLRLKAPVDPIVLLARSHGRKPTDRLELFGLPELDEKIQRWEHHFFARGIRHVPGAEDRAAALSPGQPLCIREEPGNDWDTRALQIVANEQEGCVGYVPATLLHDLAELKSRGSQISVCVLQVNLAPAPIHQRLLVRLLVDHQSGYSPFESESYQPLSGGKARALRSLLQDRSSQAE